MKPKIKKLPNGLSVLLIPMKDQLTATALILVETGSKYESKNINGIVVKKGNDSFFEYYMDKKLISEKLNVCCI